MWVCVDAGRRSTDLLHLLLQNLYFMQHVRGYVGEWSGHMCGTASKRVAGFVRGGFQGLVLQLLWTRTHWYSLESLPNFEFFDSNRGVHLQPAASSFHPAASVSLSLSPCPGTSSLLAAAVLRGLLQQQGVGREQRKALVGRIMGTHAHEMTSMVQQLMCGYDAEAGRRCGLEVRTLPLGQTEGDGLACCGML